MILIILTSTVAFAGVHVVSRKVIKHIRNKHDPNGRINPEKDEPILLTSEIFNIISIPLAIKSLTSNLKEKTTTVCSKALCGISSGFFLYDTAAHSIVTRNPQMIAHGIGCSAMYNYAALTNLLHYYAAGHMLWEISTPFVHARTIMSRLKMNSNPVYIANGAMMTLSFFLCRNVWGAVLFRDVLKKLKSGELQVPEIPKKTLLTTGVVLNTLNAFWFTRMINGLQKVIRIRNQHSG
ncbi:TLC domain-containing protein [Tetraselmis virus 1]|uniref:TLC domain-containing protein n=1 Tax=Tetraselmis virus 1 TaxID=2060617 RepID=A0A2P0VNT9_9VIRU|nr:TLC domain-containing protein [Tetraselmis virus 1]AUF82571.1 TLC domain-containing protein [Tetraselmis virus 1]